MEFDDSIRPRRPGPGFKDWLLLAIAVAFCGAAVFIWHADRRTALVTLAFFGACAATFVAIIRRKLRERRFSASVVRIVGGVDIPIARERLVALSGGAIVVGGVLFFVATEYGWLFRSGGALIALFGVAMIIAMALGLPARQFLRFDPDGIVIGMGRYRVRIPWDEIVSLGEIEFANTPFVTVGLADASRIAVEPPAAAARFAKTVASNRRWMDCDVALLTRNFGFDPPPLIVAMTRYINEPGTRHELAPPPTALTPAGRQSLAKSGLRF